MPNDILRLHCSTHAATWQTNSIKQISIRCNSLLPPQVPSIRRLIVQRKSFIKSLWIIRRYHDAVAATTTQTKGQI